MEYLASPPLDPDQATGDDPASCSFAGVSWSLLPSPGALGVMADAPLPHPCAGWDAGPYEMYETTGDIAAAATAPHALLPTPPPSAVPSVNSDPLGRDGFEPASFSVAEADSDTGWMRSERRPRPRVHTRPQLQQLQQHQPDQQHQQQTAYATHQPQPPQHLQHPQHLPSQHHHHHQHHHRRHHHLEQQYHRHVHHHDQQQQHHQHQQRPSKHDAPHAPAHPPHRGAAAAALTRGDGSPATASRPAIFNGSTLGSPPAALAGGPRDLGGRGPPRPQTATAPAPTDPNSAAREHYPIRASVANRAAGRGHDDPLLSELTAVAADLSASLGTLLAPAPVPSLRSADAAAAPAAAAAAAAPADELHAPATRSAAASALISNCRGVTGVGGAMVPVNRPDYAAADGQLSAVVPARRPEDAAAAAPTAPAAAAVSIAPATASTSASSMTGADAPRPPSAASSDAIKAEPSDAGFRTSFQFVVNENPRDARNTVRKHVMREYRRRERWEMEQRKAAAGDAAPDDDSNVKPPKKRRRSGRGSTAKEALGEMASASTADATPTEESRLAQTLAEMSSPSSSGPSPTTPHPAKRPRLTDRLPDGKSMSELAAVIPNFEEALEELERNKDLPYMADPWAAIAAADVDPFSRMQMELGPATRSLLHHFAWVMPSLMDEVVTGTVFNRLGWLYSAVAVHDPRPAHVILGFTLGHLAGLRGIQEPPLAIEHKNRAFGLISERMRDPELAVSDDNIGAVVNVAGWELIDCNPEAFALHMRALHQMVVIRGGMKALAHKPELQTVLVRLDAIRAYITLSQPRYPTYACLRSLASLAINIPPSKLNPAVHPSTPEHAEYAFCEDTLYLLHAFEDTLLLFKSTAKEHTGNTFPTSVQELVMANVQGCLAPARILPSAFARSRSRHVTRLAALVFADAAIQQYFDGDVPDSGIKRLTSRLLGQRGDKAAMAAWGRSLEMVVHVLLAADRLALERPWRAWYFADALTLTMKLGDDAWDDVAARLRLYLDERVAEIDHTVGARSSNLWSLRRVRDHLDAAWDEWWRSDPPPLSLEAHSAQGDAFPPPPPPPPSATTPGPSSAHGHAQGQTQPPTPRSATSRRNSNLGSTGGYM